MLIELEFESTSPSSMNKIAKIVRPCVVIGVQTTSDSTTFVFFSFQILSFCLSIERKKKLNLKILKNDSQV